MHVDLFFLKKRTKNSCPAGASQCVSFPNPNLSEANPGRLGAMSVDLFFFKKEPKTVALRGLLNALVFSTQTFAKRTQAVWGLCM
jgi:hypothetical protein